MEYNQLVSQTIGELRMELNKKRKMKDSLGTREHTSWDFEIVNKRLNLPLPMGVYGLKQIRFAKRLALRMIDF